jgi:putative membrane protein
MLPNSNAMLTPSLLLSAWFYTRGWLHLFQKGGRAFPRVISIGRLAAFAGGLFSVWIAIGSPLAEYDDELLSVHMIQHLLLMTAAPALILLGSPALPFLHGLPKRFVQRIVGPFLLWTPVRAVGSVLTHPAVCWLTAAATVIGWHVPPVFELGLHSVAWHVMQHTSFFVAGLLFWWPVIQPWPSTPRWPRWSMPVYLFSATLPCDALSAFLVFCGRAIYPSYHSLEDQEWAGTLMWVCITFIYVVPAMAITVRTIERRQAEAA